MTQKRLSWLLAIPLVALGCGSDSAGKSTGPGAEAGSADDGGSGDDAEMTTGGDGGSSSGNNVAPLIVDDGPPGTASVDVPFVTVTICAPGTTTCATIDHISVDTGSSGLRVISSVLPSGFTLPQPAATTGGPLAECFTYVDGYVWGSVRLADVKIAGEVAPKIPIQLIDSKYAAVPTDCSSTGSAEDTVGDFGAKGIIGINQIVADCGADCASQSLVQQGYGNYYSCSGTTCTAVAVADANQVPNPIAFFEHDSNGAVLQFPTVPSTGAKTLAGSLIFGIGTASNNGLGAASVLTVDANGNLTTVFNGQTFNTSYIDSGTNAFSFNDSAIPQCTSNQSSGFFCPTSTVSLMAQNKGLNGVTSPVSFSVANTDTLFATADTAFNDLATPYGTSDNTTFVWGFPFFIGRSVYIGLDGAATPGGKGPYVAY